MGGTGLIPGWGAKILLCSDMWQKNKNILYGSIYKVQTKVNQHDVRSHGNGYYGGK